MPRRVRSLRDAALVSMAKNIDYWAESIPEDPESYLYMLSPFEILDYGLTQLVFDALVKYKTFQLKHVHLIFHSKLDSCDLSRCGGFRLGDSTLKMLFKRCKMIKTIALSGRTRYSRNLLNVIPLRYPNLRSLAITHESITDDLILNLTSSCMNLLSFQSGTCCKIADSTFKELGKLQNLQLLSLGNADHLTGQTLLKILKSCKRLSRLALPMTLLDFKFVNGEQCFESLNSLDLTLGPVDDLSMEKIVISFPNLTNLCLSNCDKITAESLIVIGNHCKHLEILNLSYTGIRHYSYHFKHLFRKIGLNLYLIDLSGISGIKTSIFGKYCPRLEKLCLNHCPYMVTQWVNRPVGGPNNSGRDQVNGETENLSLLELCPSLVSLQIDARNKPDEETEFSLESILTGGACLKSLTINFIPDFTDVDIKSLTEYMNVKELCHFNVSGNARITSDGVWQAIEIMDKLQTLKITECDIVEMEYIDLQTKVRSKGYDVEIFR